MAVTVLFEDQVNVIKVQENLTLLTEDLKSCKIKTPVHHWGMYPFNI